MTEESDTNESSVSPSINPSVSERREGQVSLRSSSWFGGSEDPALTELYVARYLNFGLTRSELQSSRPIIGISQTGSDLSPCNRHHLDLAKRVKEGIRDAGGIPLEFPVHPIQETSRRPAAALDRNLAYIGLVEVLNGYPLDGVVFTTGCDKTTPAALMAAGTMNLPSIILSGGAMLNGWHDGERIGSGSVFFRAKKDLAAGLINRSQYVALLNESAPSIGHCNTMGTAATMNIIAETLGMSLPYCASIPAAYRQRGEMAYASGRRIVELVREGLRPSTVVTREALENAVVVSSAIGGSTNAPVHLVAIAKHFGLNLSIEDWKRLGEDVPLLVRMMPNGPYLAEDFHRAGGTPAVISELLSEGLIHGDCFTVSGRTVAENCSSATTSNTDVIAHFSAIPHRPGGLRVLRGNFFRSAVFKISSLSDYFRSIVLSEDHGHFRQVILRAIVFDGPEEFMEKIDDPALGVDSSCALVVRGVGPLGFPGSGEVVNMRPPKYLLEHGVQELLCLGDGRQSGTSNAASVLNISPEAGSGGGLALLRSGDYLSFDLEAGRLDLMLDDVELAERREAMHQDFSKFQATPGTPWEKIQASLVSELDEGMILRGMDAFVGIADQRPVPRRNYF